MANKTWIVNTPLVRGTKQYAFGDEISISDDEAASYPAGVITLKDETKAQKAQREAMEREQRESWEPEQGDTQPLPAADADAVSDDRK